MTVEIPPEDNPNWCHTYDDCEICGAAMVDAEKHERWHNAINKTLEMTMKAEQAIIRSNYQGG